MLQELIITSLIIVSLHELMQLGSPLDFVPYMIDAMIPKEFSPLLYSCIKCMSWIYGTLIFLVWVKLGVLHPFDFPIYILSLAGLNVIVEKIIDRLNYD